MYPKPWYKDEWYKQFDKHRLNRCAHCYEIMTVDIRGKFCPKCGKKNPTRIELIEQDKHPRCPRCNAERQLGAFCMECGSKTKRVALAG